MISDKQLEANRANAQNSTGPKTEAGKCKTRFNACRHGLTSQVLILTAEQQPHFDKLKRGIVAEFAPDTELELSLVDLYATYQWRLHRAGAVEEGMFSLAPDGRYIRRSATPKPSATRLRPSISSASTPNASSTRAKRS